MDFCSPFTLAQSSKQFASRLNDLHENKWHENKLRTINVIYTKVHKDDFHSSWRLSVNACKHELSLKFQAGIGDLKCSIFEVMILNENFKTMSIIKEEARVGPNE